MLVSMPPPLAHHPSPPLTPPQTTTLSDEMHPPSPSLSDDSDIAEFSLAYELNSKGEYVRVSKSSKKSSPPPTPDQSPKLRPPTPPKAPSPDAQLRRSALARTESMPVGSYEPGSAVSARSFQRASSYSQTQTPASTSTRSVPPPSTGGTARKTGGARRVRRDQYQEDVEAPRRSQSQVVEENARSSLLSYTPASRPVVPIRSTRLPGLRVGVESIAEEQEEPQLRVSAVRPRRSASFSDAPAAVQGHDTSLEQGSSAGAPYYYPPQHPRPGTSLGVSGHGARRVTFEEKMRQEREIALEEGYALREAEEAAEAERRAALLSRHSPSPPHIPASTSRLSNDRHRRDSDTLRNHIPPSSYSPTVLDPQPGRWSPQPSRRSPPETQHNYAPSVSSLQGLHRHHSTAPELPTTSDASNAGDTPPKTWAAGDGLEQELEEPYGIPPPYVPEPAPAPTRQAPAPPQVSVPAADPRRQNVNIVVNKKAYARLDMIGKGGSSRVYRVMNGANEIYAIKRVSLDKSDKETMEGYINEMQFLKRLEGNTRIIRLIDSEIKPANNAGKGTLFLVMECGEIDLARLLVEQQKKPMDIVWIAYYWKQMLEAVHVIHEEKIIHSDLKPANFVLVKGQLKLIDFGIARAIANDTTNIQRDHQIGTVNYMSPEAIEVQDGNTRIKVGRASDVWSLGCILYQMVYGRPPFHHITKVFNKMRAIPDPTHIIDFPEHSVTEVTVLRPPKDKDDPPVEEIEQVHTRVPSSVIRVLQSCLSRNHKERMTIPQLLQEEWLAMVAPEPEIREIPRQLQPDEAIINMFHMKQLLEHTLKLGRKKPKWSEQELRDHAMFLIEQLRGVTSPP